MTVTPIDQAQAGLRIDAQVRALKASGKPVIAVDARMLRELTPDLIITQDLCDVCAVADGEVLRLAGSIEPTPRLISLAARDLRGIWQDILIVGEALERREEAARLVATLEQGIAGLSANPPEVRCRVVCIEWLHPLYLAGHWVPELIWAAGGQDVLSSPGTHSAVRQWGEVTGQNPEVVLVAICGFGIERALKELEQLDDNHWLRTTSCPVWVLDGNAFTSRPGPRVVEGAVLMSSALRGVARQGLARFTGISAELAESSSQPHQISPPS